jgi:hypothetical protein
MEEHPGGQPGREQRRYLSWSQARGDRPVDRLPRDALLRAGGRQPGPYQLAGAGGHGSGDGRARSTSARQALRRRDRGPLSSLHDGLGHVRVQVRDRVRGSSGIWTVPRQRASALRRGCCLSAARPYVRRSISRADCAQRRQRRGRPKRVLAADRARVSARGDCSLGVLRCPRLAGAGLSRIHRLHHRDCGRPVPGSARASEGSPVHRAVA